MALRGDVLVARRRLGFGAEGRRELFVVLQADAVATALGTSIVAPLDDVLDVYDGDPLVTRVSAKEAGAPRPQVVLPQYLTSASLDRFDASCTGRLRPASLRAVDCTLATLLALGPPHPLAKPPERFHQ